MLKFPCTFLDAVVELSEERRQHILTQRPELDVERLGRVLSDPDRILAHEARPEQRLFCRLEPDLPGGKQIVVAVVTELERERHWVITAYTTRRIRRQGEVLWSRNL
jgi:hypothetical protein